MTQRRAGLVLEGRYELIEKVGEGGMGEVWRGEHKITGRKLALKFFLGRMGDKQRERMFREARATSRVEHPNVVEVLDAFPDDNGSPVIVMELLVGETLEDKLLRDGPLSFAEAATVLLDVIDALAAAHANGIAHRDVKPSNIFLAKGTGRPRVKVVDFGVAKVLDDDATTTAGTAIGTPAYMAPEQVRAAPGIDHRADIWGLGIVIHELLSGERPIDGPSIGALIENLVTKGVPSLAETVPDAPPELVAAVDAMLVREVEERADSFEPVAAVLAAIAGCPAPTLPRAGGVLEDEVDAASDRGPESTKEELERATTVASGEDAIKAAARAARAASSADSEATPPAAPTSAKTHDGLSRASSVSVPKRGLPVGWLALGGAAVVAIAAAVAFGGGSTPSAAPGASTPTPSEPTAKASTPSDANTGPSNTGPLAAPLPTETASPPAPEPAPVAPAGRPAPWPSPQRVKRQPPQEKPGGPDVSPPPPPPPEPKKVEPPPAQPPPAQLPPDPGLVEKPPF